MIMAAPMQDTREMLIFAVHKEESARRFYARLADEIKNKEASQIFLHLAEDENRHRQLLEKWWLESFDVSFPFDEKQVEKRAVEISRQTGALAALELAISAEKQAAEHYEHAAKNSQDESIIKLCKKLAQEEWGHFETLQAEKSSVIGSFYWFDVDNSAYVED